MMKYRDKFLFDLINKYSDEIRLCYKLKEITKDEYNVRAKNFDGDTVLHQKVFGSLRVF